MNLSTVKWAQWDKTQSRELLSIADTTMVFDISWHDCRVPNHYVKLITLLIIKKVSVNQLAIDCEVLLPAALRAAQTCRYLVYSEADFEG